MNLPGTRWRVGQFLRALLREWTDDRVPDFAGSVAFYAILSLFPAFLSLAALLGVLDSAVGGNVATRVETRVIDFLQTILTSEADSTVAAVRDLFDQARPGLLTFSLLAAFWALSRGFAALIRALDEVYDLEDERSWFRMRATALALGVGSILSAAVMLALLVVGPLLGNGRDVAAKIGMGDQFVFLWDVLRLPLAFVLLVLWAATILHVAPAHTTPWRSDLPGAVVAGVLWIVFSAGLRVYIEFAQAGNAVFGALGGVLILLLWFWLLAVAALIGGEINQLLLRDPADEDLVEPDRSESELIQSLAERAYELAGLEGPTAVEEDPHDGGRDHDTV